MKILATLVIAMLTSIVLSASGFEEVEKKILESANIQGLTLQQQSDVVILEGNATVLKDKLEAEEIAAAELNAAVVNKIVLPQTMKTDDEISMDVAARFRKKVSQHFEFNTVSVKTVSGDVVLTGQVRDAYFVSRAEEAASEVPGVKSITNKIEILPVSSFDDQLRMTILRRLTRDGGLFNYFLGTRPSVHLIVNHSRVTLVGNVNSEVDRVRAASRVREMYGVLSVDNQLKVVKGA